MKLEIGIVSKRLQGGRLTETTFETYKADLERWVHILQQRGYYVTEYAYMGGLFWIQRRRGNDLEAVGFLCAMPVGIFPVEQAEAPTLSLAA